MVIVRIFYLYHVILKLKVIDLERERWNIVHDLHFQGHGVAPRHLFIDFRTPWPKKHRYRHQDYISSMFLAKDTKNNENSALGPFKFCAARGRGTWEPTWQMCSNVSEVCRVSYMETFCEKKSGKNLQGKNYRGGCNNPPGCIRVNSFYYTVFEKKRFETFLSVSCLYKNC